ncbi:uncharacterized protein LOC125139391 [Tachysurus fulvidraco]|uniref:uncharacterized protein LOC125139391 n=1 Tax=Tachysurus fulvidraco TaxID=1234273 RepID=UPI001FEFF57F|nr:uncharacterized protein LOC125139391 [Tachysurus fulvidraco]
MWLACGCSALQVLLLSCAPFCKTSFPHRVGQESWQRASFYPEEREDQENECDSANEVYALKSEEVSLLSSDDHQSMDTPNTFDRNIVLFSIGRNSGDFDSDQQSGTETERNNVSETKGSSLKSCLFFQSALQVLLLSCASFCKTSFPHRVGQESWPRASFYLEEREDQENECDSANEVYALKSEEVSLLSSDDHQSMDTPNTFEGNIVLFSIGRNSGDFDSDQQSGTETERNNSALQVLLLSCAPFCKTSFFHRGQHVALTSYFILSVYMTDSPEQPIRKRN